MTAVLTWERAEDNERAYFSLLAQTPPVEGAAVLINPECPALLINRAMSLRFPPDHLGADLARLEAPFLHYRIPPSVYLTPASAPSGLRRALMARGYRTEYRQTVMAYDLGEGGWGGVAGPARGAGPAPAAGPLSAPLQVLETRGPAEYDAWCRVFLKGFEVPPDMHMVMYEMNLRSLRHPQVTGLLGLVDGEPVATTCLFVEGDTAGLYAVSTIPKARRRGVAGAMVRRALDLARAQGATLAVLQTGTGGDPERLYRTLGFRDLFVAEVMTRHA